MAGILEFIKGNKLTLVEKIHEGGDIYSFVFKPERLVEWKAGQHMLINVKHENADKKGSNRMFSVAEAPYAGTIRISTHIGNENATSYKRALQNLEIGSEVVGRGPVGPMTVQNAEDRHVFIAGGIGITPFRSILRDLDHAGKKINATLLYSNRDENFLYKQELDAIASRHPELLVKYIVAPERITAETIKAAVSEITKPVFMISGPRGMVSDMKKVLKSLGAKKIKSDPFFGY